MNNKIPINLNSFLNIESDCSWANDQFCVFETLKKEFYLIFRINFKIKCFNLEKMNQINEFDIFKKQITCIRHYNKIIKNKDLILICIVNEIKIYDFYDNLKNIVTIDNKKHIIYLLYNSAFLYNNLNKNYIIVSNFNEKYLELFDFKGNLIKNICYDNKKGVHFIDIYYDDQINKTFIITNKGFNNKFEICSYIFENENENFYNCFKSNNYMKNFQLKRIKNIVFLFTSAKNEIFQYDFHQGILHKKITIHDNNIKLNMILIWNENYIFSSSENNQIFLFDINKGILIKQYKHNKKNNLSVYGLKTINIKNKKYLISQGKDRIIIWK